MKSARISLGARCPPPPSIHTPYLTHALLTPPPLVGRHSVLAVVTPPAHLLLRRPPLTPAPCASVSSHDWLSHYVQDSATELIGAAPPYLTPCATLHSCSRYPHFCHLRCRCGNLPNRLCGVTTSPMRLAQIRWRTTYQRLRMFQRTSLLLPSQHAVGNGLLSVIQKNFSACNLCPRC